jgi:hypothetical protein
LSIFPPGNFPGSQRRFRELSFTEIKSKHAGTGTQHDLEARCFQDGEFACYYDSTTTVSFNNILVKISTTNSTEKIHAVVEIEFRRISSAVLFLKVVVVWSRMFQKSIDIDEQYLVSQSHHVRRLRLKKIWILDYSRLNSSDSIGNGRHRETKQRNHSGIWSQH